MCYVDYKNEKDFVSTLKKKKKKTSWRQMHKPILNVMNQSG